MGEQIGRHTLPELQLRKSEQNGFHDMFLISQPNTMMWPSLKSSLWDDLNEWSHHSVCWEIRKLAFWKLSILDLICCPVYRIHTVLRAIQQMQGSVKRVHHSIEDRLLTSQEKTHKVHIFNECRPVNHYGLSVTISILMLKIRTTDWTRNYYGFGVFWGKKKIHKNSHSWLCNRYVLVRPLHILV